MFLDSLGQRVIWAVCAIPAVAFGLGVAAFVAAQPRQPIQWSLKPSVPRARIGQKFNLLLTAQIEEGWHLYSTQPMPNGPTATRIAVPAGTFHSAGTIQASDPLVVFDPTFKTDVELYVRQACFQIPLKTAERTKPGKQLAALEITFQTCNDRICLPPTKVTVTTPITVVGAANDP